MNSSPRTSSRTLPGANRTAITAALALGALMGLVAADLGLRGVLNFGHYALWILAWAALGGLLGWRGYLGLVTVAAAASVLLLLLIAATPIAAGLTTRWVRADSVRTPLDAIVVLSSDVKSDSLLDGGGTERLLTGIELLRATHAPRLLTTRVQSTYRGQRLSTDMGQRRLLSLAGVDSGWTITDPVASTRDESVNAARLLLPASPRIAVVTSPLHTRRACATFEGAGFTVTCVPAREVVRVTRDPVMADDRLAAFRAYIYERLGMIKYRWKGWIHA